MPHHAYCEIPIYKSESKDPKVKHSRFRAFIYYCTWGWLSEVLKLANQRPLMVNDLFAAPCLGKTEELTQKLEKLWLEEQTLSRNSGKAPQLWRAVLKLTPCIDCIAYIAKTFVMMFCDISRAILLWFLLTKISTMNTSQKNFEYYCVCGMVFAGIVRSYTSCQWTLQNNLIITNIKASLVGLMYKKIRTASACYLARRTTGHVINLASKDLEAIGPFYRNILGLYLTPFYLLCVCLISWKLIGWQATASVIYALALMLYQTAMGKYFYRIRKKTSMVTDERLRLVSDVITGIRVVKANVWEWALQSLISQKRRQELSLIFQKNTIESSFRAFSSAYVVVTTLIPVILMVMTGKPLTPQNVFTIMALWSSTQKAVTVHFNYAVQHLAQAYVVLGRIQNFLLDDISKPQELISKQNAEDIDKTSYLTLGDVPQSTQAKYLQNSDSKSFVKRNFLVDVVLEVSQVTCKWDTTIKETCLRGINIEARKCELIGITGPVGCGKSSLMSVILGELQPNEGHVITKGSVTYVSQTPWLFSGTIKENILFGRAFSQDRYNKALKVCELLADLDVLPFRDQTIIGERGVILSGGQQSRVCMARAVYCDADIYLLDEPLSAVDATIGQRIYRNCICEALSDRVRVLVTHRVQFLKDADWIYVMNEGYVSSQGNYDNLLTKSTYFSNVAKTREPEVITDKVEKHQTAEKAALKSLRDHENCEGDSFVEEDRLTGAVSYKTYYYYLRAGVSKVFIVLLILLVFLPDVVSVVSSFWLAEWTRKANKNSNEFYMTVYGTLAGASLLVSFFRSLSILTLSIRSSRSLHHEMLTSVLKSPVRFFDTNPAGRILNRFAKDIGGVDEVLPSAIQQLTDYCIQILGALVVASLVIPWVVIVIVPLLFLAYYLCSYTLRGARELKRLAAITASPVYAHFAETMRGISTIRAFGQSDEFLNTLYRYQDVSNEASSLAMVTSRWLYIRMDLLSSIIITVAGFAFILTGSDSAMVGLGISYLLQLTATTTWAFDHASEVESEMTSVERIMSYSHLPSELGYENDVTPPRNWPIKGTVNYVNVSFSYYKNGPEVLKDISFTINDNERVGIVGRTGAGKSSLVSSLLRMPDCQGDIFVDGVSINTVNIQKSRAAIAFIPQDPFLFNGTLRMNIDPSGSFEDGQMLNSLEQVQLSSILQVRVAHGRSPLDYQITEHGSNLSVGERQLVCLARAMLQNKKIIVLDEATASVDYKTDRIIQSIIRSNLTNRTLLTIAHRLDTVMDYDRIMVVDGGRLVEFDTPLALLQNKNGHFSKMYNAFLINP